MKQVIKAIKEGKRFLIVSHYHPDGDALGSTLALGLALKKLKKKVVMYNRDVTPFNLQFLPHSKEITNTFPKEDFDCAIMADCAQPKRISAEFAEAFEQKRFKKVLCIDHHILDKKIADIDWIDRKAASTGFIVWKLLKALKLHKNKAMANLIYATLVVDTGSFRYSNTTEEVFELAAELLKYGAEPWLVSQNLDESNPAKRYVLLGSALKTLSVDSSGEYATMEVTREMLKEVDNDESLTDEFGNFPRSIAGVEVSAFFREMDETKVKVSLRSKQRVDVSAITKGFGGGGHKHAAGCVLRTDLATAKKQIAAEVAKSLRA